MSVLAQLSSQVGDRSQEANRRVVAQCLADPALLSEIATGLPSQDTALAGDCAEVLTQVAEQEPALVAPHAAALVPLLAHRNTRVRWEAAHALALAAALVPEIIAPLLPRLAEIIRRDPSVIVRDYAVDAIGNYARTGPAAAQAAHPILREALALWEGKHVGRALNGLRNVASAEPDLADELRAIGQQYLDDRRAVVRKAAKALIRAI